MRICFVADFRSPIARNWISYFTQSGYEVHVISSYPCPTNDLGARSFYVVPIAFSGLSYVWHSGPTARRHHSIALLKPLLAYIRGCDTSSKAMSVARHWLSPLDLYRHVRPVQSLIESMKPDFVHAMRVPFEGILAALAIPKVPLLISVWGNDFTLHAQYHLLTGLLTRKAMQRADGLHCDCFRDIRLAHVWGFDDSKPSVVLPSAGGVQLSIFHSGPPNRAASTMADIPSNAPVVINPRGFRGYVRNDTFFRAIPLVLQQRPDAVFLCSAMQNNPVAERWVRQLSIRQSVRLLPLVPREEMADFFRFAQVTVSPSVHDGTPNTLLEAMACGCFPVAGDIESVREWITDGVNGLLCDPADPESLASAIVRALSDADLRLRAANYNLKLIAERAEYGKVMAQAELFYQRIVEMAKR